MCEVSSCSTKNSRHFELHAQVCNQSIRWKAFRVEATHIPSLGWQQCGSGFAGLLRQHRRKATGSELLAGAQAFRRTSRRSQDRRRKSGTLVRTTCAMSSHRMDSVGGACKRQGVSEVGGFRGEGSLSGNNAQRVSVASVERRASNGSSARKKEPGFGRWSRSQGRFTGKQGTRHGLSYRSWRG